LAKSNQEDLKNAINVIEKQNHHLFYPKYDKWMIVKSDPNRQLRKEEFVEEVVLYIEKYAPEVVPELKKIIGKLY